MIVKRRSWQTFYNPQHGKPKKIIVWRNGDFDSPGQEVTLHAKYLRSWNALLGYLTLLLEPRWGAVRRLYHLPSRKPVLCLQEIQADEQYVAAGTDKLKLQKKCYQQSETQKHIPNDSTLEYQGNFMAYAKKKRRTVVYLMVSGRGCQAPLKVVLIESDLVDYNMILEYLSYRLDVGEGIHFLCNANGKVISNLSSLKHGQLYVAVPFNEKFIKLDYQKIFAEYLPQINLEVPTETLPKQKKKTNTKKKEVVESSELKEEVEIVEVPSSKSDFTSFEEEEFYIMKAKCVGTKCFDYKCRVYRDEFISQAGSLSQHSKHDEYRADMSTNTDGAHISDEPLKYEQFDEHGADMGTNTKARISDSSLAALRNDIFDIVEEVTIVGSIVNEVVEDSISRASSDRSNDGSSSVPFRLVKPTSESLYTVDIKGREKNYTTFAEIVENSTKEAEQPYSARPFGNTSIFSQASKKSVSFGNTGVPETIFEGSENDSSEYEDICRLPRGLPSLKKRPKASILKTAEHDSSSSDDEDYGDDNKPPERSWNSSFLRARDSLSIHGKSPEALIIAEYVKEQLRLEKLEGSDKEESLELLYKEQSPDMISKILVQDLFEDINVAQEDESFTAKAVQKDWKPDEDIMEKGVQSDDIPDFYKERRCLREKCTSFACSYICLADMADCQDACFEDSD